MAKQLAVALILAVVVCCTHALAADATVATGTVSNVALQGDALQSFLLTDSAGATLTVSVSATTRYYLGADPGVAADIVPGVTAEVALVAPPVDGVGNAATVRVLLPPASAPETITGTVLSVALDLAGALDSFVLSVPAAGATPAADVTIGVSPGTAYTLGPITGAATDVTAGADVAAQLASPPSDNAGTALSVKVLPPARLLPVIVSGMVERLTTDANDAPRSFVLQLPARDRYSGGALTVALLADTRFRIGEAPGSPADLLAGAKAVAQLQTAPRNDAGAALWVRIIPPKGVHRHGTVQSIAADSSGVLQSFVLHVAATPYRPASDLTVSVSPGTAYRFGAASGLASNVLIGSRAKVQFQSPPGNVGGMALLVDVSPSPTVR